MSNINYRNPGSEVLVADFIDGRRWGEAKASLVKAGVHFKPFIGKDGSVQPVRKLASEPPKSPKWQSAVSRLYEDVEIARELISRAGYGFCNFGPATKNLNYEPPITEQAEGGGTMTTYSRRNSHEFNFFDEEQLRESHWPILPEDPGSAAAISGLAVVLQYRECF